MTALDPQIRVHARFHHEDDVLAAYEEAEAAVWRSIVNYAGEPTIQRRVGESRGDAVRRFARAVADAVIRSDPSAFSDLGDISDILPTAVERSEDHAV